MRGFIEYTDDVVGSRTIVPVHMIMLITENRSGKAVIFLKDHIDRPLTAVESYDEIWERLGACMEEGT